MLNFDEARYLSIQFGAVGLAGEIDAAIADALGAGAENIFFLGTGGAGILMQPAALLLQRHSTFPAFIDYVAELVIVGSKKLNERSIVVIPSLSGTTQESIAMLEFARKAGARIMTLVGKKETPLGEGGEHVFVNAAADDTSSESFYIQSLLIALSIMKQRGEIDDYDRLVAELARLPAALVEAKRSFETRAEEIATVIDNADYHIFTGAGNVWAQAHYYGMCILEEMQWIRTRPVHASDFFHGTLELLEKGVSLFIFKGEDACRPLAERVADFAPRYTDRITTIDTKEFALPGIGDALRPLVSPVLLAALLERVSAHLEVKRDHPLTTRRYYKRVPY
jgi:fructoselysine-6-phosphate deglycase